MYMDNIFFSFFYLFASFFLDLSNDGNNGNRVLEASNRPCDRHSCEEIFFGKLVQFYHAVESPLH